MTIRANKPDAAHRPRFIEKDIRPVEFIVRGGYASIKNVAAFLDYNYVTIYKWSVLRKIYPPGFPEAVRMGLAWRIAWDDVLKWKDGLNTYADDKRLGLNMYDPLSKTGEMIEYDKLFVRNNE